MCIIRPWIKKMAGEMAAVTSIPYVNLTNTTSCTPDDTAMAPEWGYITAAIAVVFYGSNFAPVKKFETGDGMFFQWILCSGIMLTGIVIQLIRNSTFYPIVMLGGVLWETGNICVVPIIKCIGLGLGMCIWGMTNLLSGWATGRFGLFDTKAEVPDRTTLDYVGVSLAVISAFVFSFVKNELHPTDLQDESNEDEHKLLKDHMSTTYGSSTDSLYTTTNTQDVLVFNRRRGSSVNQTAIDEFGRDSDNTFVDKLSPGSKRILGVLLSLGSGVFYGQLFTAATYIQDWKKGASQNGLDYVFACFCGIYLTSTVYFCVYIILKKNKPRLYPKAILPAVVSGIMWGIATACWFIANKVLSVPVAFPIITTIPAVVASIWGVFVFKEIRGIRNIALLLLGFCFCGAGAAMAGMSKDLSKHC